MVRQVLFLCNGLDCQELYGGSCFEKQSTCKYTTNPIFSKNAEYDTLKWFMGSFVYVPASETLKEVELIETSKVKEEKSDAI